MIDITKIELNNIALPISELQSMNAELRSTNYIFNNIIIVGGAVLLIILINNISKYKDGRNEKEIRDGFPRFEGNHSIQ